MAELQPNAADYALMDALEEIKVLRLEGCLSKDQSERMRDLVARAAVTARIQAREFIFQQVNGSIADCYPEDDPYEEIEIQVQQALEE